MYIEDNYHLLYEKRAGKISESHHYIFKGFVYNISSFVTMSSKFEIIFWQNINDVIYGRQY